MRTAQRRTQRVGHSAMHRAQQSAAAKCKPLLWRCRPSTTRHPPCVHDAVGAAVLVHPRKRALQS
eukprot:26575-Chlamydomonas_euryale.AAC.1